MQLPTYGNVLEMIGNTPLMAVRRIDTGPCRLFLKLESANPGGSIKDRIGLYHDRGRRARRVLKPGGTAHRGHRRQHRAGPGAGRGAEGLQPAAGDPRQDGQEKIFHLRGHGRRGADDPLRRRQGPPEYYQDIAERLAREMPGAYFVNQFGNPANALAHETTTAPEIWEQMDGRAGCGGGAASAPAAR